VLDHWFRDSLFNTSKRWKPIAKSISCIDLQTEANS